MSKHSSGYKLLLFFAIMTVVCVNIMADPNSTGCVVEEIDGICPEESVLAYDFSAFDLQGKHVRLSDFRNNIVLLNFWASWCIPCIRELPRLQELHEFMLSENMVVLTVNVKDRLSRVKKIQKKNDYRFGIIVDRDGFIYKAFGVNLFPTTFLIAKDGRILGWITGDKNWSSDRFVNYLKALSKRES